MIARDCWRCSIEGPGPAGTGTPANPFWTSIAPAFAGHFAVDSLESCGSFASHAAHEAFAGVAHFENE